MAILVTGGAGYIGSHFVYGLVDRNFKAVVLDNLSTGFRYAVPGNVPLVVGDIGDEALILKTISEHKIESIVHFAASTVVPDSVAQPLSYYRNNTANSRTLIEAAITLGVRYFVFSSTAAVYGDTENVAVSEKTKTQPISPYGKSKLMTEIMLEDAANVHDFKYSVLRYFNVAGADPKQRTGQSTRAATHLIKVACQVALGARPHLEIFGSDYPTPDGTCMRDYIHVSDLVDAHVAALAFLEKGGESVTFNCGYGSGYSVLQVVEAVKRASGHDLPIVFKDRRAGDPVAVVADTSQIRSRLHWTPAYEDLDLIVTHALEWERRLLGNRVSSSIHGTEGSAALEI